MPQTGKSPKKPNQNAQKRSNIMKTKNWTHTLPIYTSSKKKRPPYCIPCQKPYTIKYILTECIDLKPIQQKYYQTTNLKQIFHQINPKKLLWYIKGVHIYNIILKF